MTFPFFSQEARSTLGLPDSPAIHLAVTSLAERLGAFAEGTHLDLRAIRITALRTASRAVLEELPFEQVVFDFQTSLGLPGDQAAAEEAYRTTRTDWLGQAVAKIEAMGLSAGLDARRMATPYGWNTSIGASAEADTRARPLAQQGRSVLDEHGRTWVPPSNTAGLKILINEYGRRHGRPSEAVAAAFARHPGKLDTLRMLVLRGAEGERINLAARALALGPLPPMRRQRSAPRDGAQPKDGALQGVWAADDERDRRLARDLEHEAVALRDRGYID